MGLADIVELCWRPDLTTPRGVEVNRRSSKMSAVSFALESDTIKNVNME